MAQNRRLEPDGDLGGGEQAQEIPIPLANVVTGELAQSIGGGGDMRNPNELFLYEEIMLLALRDEKGTVAPGTMYTYALGGAILADLLLHNRIRLAETRGKKYVEPLSSLPFGDPLIDECLARIESAKRRATIQTWVTRFAGIRRLGHRAAEQLCRRGILRAEEGSILFIFSRTTYPQRDPRPERALIERMREAIATDTRDVDPRTAVIISLAKSAGLLRLVFDKDLLKKRKARIDKLAKGEVIGNAAKEAIEAAQMAMVAATVVPAIAATTVNH